MRVLVMGVACAMGCASHPHPVVVTVPHPNPPTVAVATGLEDAKEYVTIYEHDTTDPDNDMPTVGGYVRVKAPIETAYEVATRFGAYRLLNPDYIEQTTVVDRQPDVRTTDLYIKVPTVIGQYVWAVVRFAPVQAKAGFAYRGDQVSGNLDDLRILWRLIPAGADETIAQFEFLADPHLPIPRAWILPEVREGVRIILTHFRNFAEDQARWLGKTPRDER